MTRSNFPNNVDSLPELSNILTSDQPNVDRYKTLLMQATRTSDEETELNNLKTTLATKLVDAEYFNFLSDAIVATQNYFLNQVKADLAKLDVGVLKGEIDAHEVDFSDPHLSYAQAIEWVKNYGIGSDGAKDITNSNLNDLEGTGFYNGNNLTNAPSTDTYWIIHSNGKNSSKFQLAIVDTLVEDSPPLIFIRQYYQGWKSWNPLHIENGSNANGNYIKYPDGTLIQWFHVTYMANSIAWSTATQAGTTYYYTSTSWNYPMTFADTAPISVHASGDIPTFGIEQHKAYFPNTSFCKVEQGVLGINPTTMGAISCYKSLFAIGRWK
jgi:hypothetical protein